MLQRAASNAYSWWWASHVRTKQSKWLEQNLADMEEKVHNTLKLIEEEGDSFAKRAEMYYKSRPELIAFIQESFRSYRALAERYDHISTELQKANTALASVFPEQVQFSMEEEEEYNKLKEAAKVTQALQQNVPKAPPTGPVKQLRTMFSNAVKFQNKQKPNKTSPSNDKRAHKSGLSKDDALARIDKLQKEILVLQTEKEFLKSSYEHGIAKYNAIDKEINEMQEQVSSLQDEFGDGMFIQDEEARSIMSSAALKSCQEALAKLQEKQKMTKEAKVEHKRLKAIRKKLDALMMKKSKSKPKPGDKQPEEARKRLKNKEQKVERIAEEHEKEMEMLRAKIKEHFEDGEGSSLTVTEMAEKIDELVNKVISLESAVSSQAALIRKLRMEIDGLQSQIQTLEDNKASGSEDVTTKLNKMEEKLQEIQDLDQNVQDQSNNLETHFTEAHCNLDHLSEKLSSLKPDEESNIIKVDVNKSSNSKKESNAKKDSSIVNKMEGEEVTFHDSLEDKEDKEGASVEAEQNGEPNWRLLYMKGMGDREKTLLEEYTTVLRDYKELKKQNDVVEGKSQDGLLETLKAANAMKDEEIRTLREKLKHLQAMFNTIKDGGELKSDTQSPKSLGKMMEENHDIKFDPEVSPIEEKFRGDIDALQEGNLDFWLRFSTSFHQIQKFETEFKDLKDDVSKLEAEKKSDIINARKSALKTEARSIYKHLREIETELNVWLEESGLLKEELQTRFSALCSIQEEITKALQDSTEDGEFKFTKFQAAKFEGELLNMKQENHKVVDELHSGLDNVKGLQLQVEQCLAGLNDKFELGDVKENTQLQRSNSKNQIPLSSFLFGVKPKKQKQSFFSVVTNELNKKYIIK